VEASEALAWGLHIPDFISVYTFLLSLTEAEGLFPVVIYTMKLSWEDVLIFIYFMVRYGLKGLIK